MSTPLFLRRNVDFRRRSRIKETIGIAIFVAFSLLVAIIGALWINK